MLQVVDGVRIGNLTQRDAALKTKKTAGNINRVKRARTTDEHESVNRSLINLSLGEGRTDDALRRVRFFLSLSSDSFANVLVRAVDSIGSSAKKVD